MLSEIDYKKDMKIDESALDVEWLNQSSLALKYGRNVSHLRYEVNKLEEEKKTVRSELIIEANKHPEECCNKKSPNANDIEAYYRADKRYQEVVNKLLEAKYELEYAEIAYSEMSYTRKASLENLVKLFISNYFAGPKTPRDLVKEIAENRKSEVPVRMKRRESTINDPTS